MVGSIYIRITHFPDKSDLLQTDVIYRKQWKLGGDHHSSQNSAALLLKATDTTHSTELDTHTAEGEKKGEIILSMSLILL